MAGQSRAFWVGAFVFAGVIIGVTALVFLGVSDWFAKKHTYVTYFDASVQGLNVDAEVKFRGVDVGKVTKINLAPDNYLIEVVMDLRPDFRVSDSLRCKLGLTGITGLRYIELNFVDHETLSEHPQINFKPAYAYIPSYPGGFEEIEQSLRAIYDRLIAVDTEGISHRTKRLLDTSNSTAERADSVLVTADSLLRDPVLTLWMRKMSNTVDHLDALVGELDAKGYDARMNEALTELNAGAHSFNQLFGYLGDEAQAMRLSSRSDTLFASLEVLINTSQQMVLRSQFATTQTFNNLNSTLVELNTALNQMNSLMMSLESYPSNMIYTAPPEKEK